MIADLVKDLYPDNISFTMRASGGEYEGTFGINHPKVKEAGPAKITGTRIPNTDLYNVVATFARPYPGPYRYKMPYDVLVQWEKNSGSGTWYNANIRGVSKYFPDEPIS